MVGLVVENLSVRYGNTEIVSGISARIPAAGGLTALIGPNAAGKSSFFKRIAGLARGARIERCSQDRPLVIVDRSLD